jgi:acetyl esterase/lipase
MVAITYANREPMADLHALIDHVRQNARLLGIDSDRIGVWASSGNVPLALSLLMQREHVHPKCAVLCYGYMLDLDGATGVADAAGLFKFTNPNGGQSADDLALHLPLFIARAGADQMPHLNASIDRFVAAALARNLPITVTNHSTGPHAFDLFDDSATSRAVIRQILVFLRFHLLARAGGRADTV